MDGTLEKFVEDVSLGDVAGLCACQGIDVQSTVQIHRVRTFWKRRGTFWDGSLLYGERIGITWSR